ncbi:hypothetical protein BLA18110_04094 [Burkholderia lata]|nr:hypothetical protein BLA50215_00300 [Burkholderia lata]VWD01635.1 hypothetical protein BLA18110_04094 [Burkholderia lata]
MNGLYGVEMMLASASGLDGYGGMPRYRIVQPTFRMPN